MADEEIVAKLREPPPQDAVTAANRLSELLERPLVHGAMIKYFKTAFPLVPLGLLMEATQWTRFGAADLTDEDFNELLAPWIGPVQTIDEKRIELARIRSEIDETSVDDFSAKARTARSEIGADFSSSGRSQRQTAFHTRSSCAPNLVSNGTSSPMAPTWCCSQVTSGNLNRGRCNSRGWSSRCTEPTMTT